MASYVPIVLLYEDHQTRTHFSYNNCTMNQIYMVVKHYLTPFAPWAKTHLKGDKDSLIKNTQISDITTQKALKLCIKNIYIFSIIKDHSLNKSYLKIIAWLGMKILFNNLGYCFNKSKVPIVVDRTLMERPIGLY